MKAGYVTTYYDSHEPKSFVNAVAVRRRQQDRIQPCIADLTHLFDTGGGMVKSLENR
jgi:hypothetical protein